MSPSRNNFPACLLGKAEFHSFPNHLLGSEHSLKSSETISIPAHNVVKFRAGKKLRTLVKKN